jgi:hypothetical protein
MSLERRNAPELRIMPVAARIDPCDDMMTVAADLESMPDDRRQAFMQAWEAWAAERGMGVRFTGPWHFAIVR